MWLREWSSFIIEVLCKHIGGQKSQCKVNQNFSSHILREGQIFSAHDFQIMTDPHAVNSDRSCVYVSAKGCQ